MEEDVEDFFDKEEHCGHQVSGVDKDGNETETVIRMVMLILKKQMQVHMVART